MRCTDRATSPLALHRELGSEAHAVAEDRRHRERAAAGAVGHRAISRRDVALDLHAVPARRMSDVGDRDVVMLAPEERHRVEALALTARPREHVPRGRLTLTF